MNEQKKKKKKSNKPVEWKICVHNKQAGVKDRIDISFTDILKRLMLLSECYKIC